MNPKTFFKRWKQGIMELSALYLLKAKIVGYIGTIVGVIIGGTISIAFGFWYFSLALVFIILLQSIELVSVLQQYKQGKKMEAAIKAAEEKDGLRNNESSN